MTLHETANGLLALGVSIGDGHEYSVLGDKYGKVLKTACKGRWPLSRIPTGSEWLDGKLREAFAEALVEYGVLPDAGESDHA